MGGLVFGVHTHASPRPTTTPEAARCAVPTSIGRLPGFVKAYGLDVSGDGSTIVGYNWFDLDDEDAFIWNEARGMHALIDVLSTYGLDLTGWGYPDPAAG